MDLIDHLQTTASRIQKQRDHIQTEEATKNAFVMPFINALGYDVFNPLEVVPEFTCDVGTKKGEKVDYAIMRDGHAIILIECKTCGRDLDTADFSQLVRYFHVTDARIAILTNGIVYRFYTDLEQPNKMDEKPYLELNLLDIHGHTVNEVKKLTKSGFDLDKAVNAASDLKYTREVRAILAREIDTPGDDFVRFFASQVYSGRLTQAVKDNFSGIIKRAVTQYINERINERLKSALAKEEKQDEEIASEVEDELGMNGTDPRIETTEEEMEGYYIIKSIVRKAVEPDRIYHRDTISYFGILLDDNNRKPVCRLHFNRSQKFIGLFDENKKEERIPINNLNDIFDHEETLLSTVTRYEN